MASIPSSLPLVYCSPYYKKSVHSGANRRFEELIRRFQEEFPERFILIVAKGEKPDWYHGRVFEVDYTFNHVSKFRTWYQIEKILSHLPPALVINEFIPIPFLTLKLKRHRHCQVVYDFRYFTSTKGSLYRLLFGSFLKYQWRYSEYIVTCSDFSIDELQKYVGFDAQKVIKSYFGIDAKLLDRGDQEVSTSKTIDLLYVGHFETRKNHINLIEALKLLPKELVVKLVGVDNGLQTMLENRCREYGLVNVSFETINDDAKLWPLYEQSKLFVFPSIYEGFGIPLIEALSLNVPVVCSDIPVFREVGGDMATYFDPLNPDSIAQVMSEALSTPTKLDRARVRQHVDNFLWDTIYRRFVTDLLQLPTPDQR
ncbi:MAG: glycosyltransferase family 4 protein [Candidatus Buchananbacteria bacterium]|nr:glycosyltransferase family 4 protein [Candidatus Buchananbacteria bacterium]